MNAFTYILAITITVMLITYCWSLASTVSRNRRYRRRHVVTSIIVAVAVVAAPSLADAACGFGFIAQMRANRAARVAGRMAERGVQADNAMQQVSMSDCPSCSPGYGQYRTPRFVYSRPAYSGYSGYGGYGYSGYGSNGGGNQYQGYGGYGSNGGGGEYGSQPVTRAAAPACECTDPDCECPCCDKNQASNSGLQFKSDEVRARPTAKKNVVGLMFRTLIPNEQPHGLAFITRPAITSSSGLAFNTQSLDGVHEGVTLARL